MLALSAFVLLTVLPGDASAQETTESTSPRFEVNAKRFVKEFCIDCHGPDTQEGEIRLDTVDHDLSNDDTVQIWNRIFAQLQFGEMPPEDSTQPQASVTSDFLQQIEAELTRFDQGSGLAEKLLLPQFGNYVDHTSLFDGSVTEMPYTSARLWRQRPIIYDAIWGNAYGRAPRNSVKIGGTGNHLIARGPHKGKLMATRYFAV